MFVMNSLYEYDDSQQYLTSVTIGNITVIYSYNNNGDLIGHTDEYGIQRTIGYDSNSLVNSKQTYNLDAEVTSHVEFLNSWNGKVDIHSNLPNSTDTVVYDLMGNAISLISDSSLPQVYQELPNGKRILIGDEVSAKSIVIMTSFSFKKLSIFFYAYNSHSGTRVALILGYINGI